MAFRSFAAAGLAAGLLLTSSGAADKEADAAKKALQQVGELVGEWNGKGEAKAGGRSTLWKETLSWGWKFKDGDSWVTLSVKGGKYLTGGELRYDPEKKLYRLTVTDAAKKEAVYEGRLTKDRRLVLNRKDPATGDVHRLAIYTVSQDAGLVVRSEVQSKGKGLFADEFQVFATREGESFAGGGKKNECVVTGGLGTIPVSYMGKTYYVCCSGCRDEFNANPKKYVDEYEKKKK